MRILQIGEDRPGGDIEALVGAAELLTVEHRRQSDQMMHLHRLPVVLGRAAELCRAIAKMLPSLATLRNELPMMTWRRCSISTTTSRALSADASVHSVKCGLATSSQTDPLCPCTAGTADPHAAATHDNPTANTPRGIMRVFLPHQPEAFFTRETAGPGRGPASWSARGAVLRRRGARARGPRRWPTR